MDVPFDPARLLQAVATSEAEVVLIGGLSLFDVTIPVLDLDGLMRTKRAAGRTKDLAVLPEIEALLHMRAHDSPRDEPQ